MLPARAHSRSSQVASARATFGRRPRLAAAWCSLCTRCAAWQRGRLPYPGRSETTRCTRSERRRRAARPPVPLVLSALT
jgi:hypothetical protein